MNKSLILLSCLLSLLSLTLSQNLITDSPVLLGGYAGMTSSDLKDDPIFQEIEDFARKEYSTRNNGLLLGQLKSADRQLVAGFNYKMVFDSAEGLIEVVVFDQSWTQTREVTSIKGIENTA